MKKVIFALMMMSSSLSLGHDEGHGPKLTDSGKYGGLVSGVILKADIKKGVSASLVYKAELVKSSDGTLRVYFYDTKMTALDIKGFEFKATAISASKVKGKYVDTPFSLEIKGNYFIGKMPKPLSKPYNIDVTVKEGGRELLTAFDNLD
jgi:hypothetical protein